MFIRGDDDKILMLSNRGLNEMPAIPSEKRSTLKRIVLSSNDISSLLGNVKQFDILTLLNLSHNQFVTFPFQLDGHNSLEIIVCIFKFAFVNYDLWFSFLPLSL
jgi:Leucine-rich repeat (LRR) protein